MQYEVFGSARFYCFHIVQVHEVSETKLAWVSCSAQHSIDPDKEVALGEINFRQIPDEHALAVKVLVIIIEIEHVYDGHWEFDNANVRFRGDLIVKAGNVLFAHGEKLLVRSGHVGLLPSPRFIRVLKDGVIGKVVRRRVDARKRPNRKQTNDKKNT